MNPEIIVLNDSNESDISVESNDKLKNTKKKNKKKCSFDDYDSSDFEFPEVQFYHPITENNEDELQNIYNKHSFISNIHAPSYQTNDKYTVNKNLKQYNMIGKSLYSDNNSFNSAKNSDEKNRNIAKQKKDIVKKEEKIQQMMKEKALKAIAIKKSKNIKPGECLKFMEVIIDKGIENFSYITDIISTLLNTNLQYSIKSQFISNSITWKRNIENHYVNENNEICTITNIENIDQILIIWNWDETVIKVANDNFCTSISDIKSLLPDYKIILVIFGIENYFAYKMQEKNSDKNETKNKMQKTNIKNNLEYKNFVEISRRQLEICLNEIQIIADCSSRLINNSQDLALMIYQCTKAIAEIPYKLEKNKSLTNKFNWYILGDNRNTVKVDKDGNGLKRLWQQQLCQFNLSSLEIAEAICSVYPCPADLIETYINCTDDEGINLLKDIPIRRAAGPLTAIRKVGPELSKKIYLMFTSKNGESVLN
ncbi:crossover junction endonuclease EME1 [Apis dorsata]|uniref:crossover junction endonuclease EME1 n=1 Tax=Apis dorsata TaxID=7462 RepID=UPI0003DF5352|nr:crossover junction endonuclease EME1 [Apis dorsata]